MLKGVDKLKLLRVVQNNYSQEEKDMSPYLGNQ